MGRIRSFKRRTLKKLAGGDRRDTGRALFTESYQSHGEKGVGRIYGGGRWYPQAFALSIFTETIKDQVLAKIEPVILQQHHISKWAMVAEEIQKAQVAQPTISSSEHTLSATALEERYHKIKDPAQNYDTTLTEVERVATKDVGDLPPTSLQL